MYYVHQDISSPECDVEVSGFLYLRTKSMHYVFEECPLMAYPAKTRSRQLNLSYVSHTAAWSYETRAFQDSREIWIFLIADL